jgi:hypothetical protein
MEEVTIEDLLNALQNPEKTSISLENTKETWRRIGNKDKFVELGLEDGELENFLKEFVEDNPYSNL